MAWTRAELCWQSGQVAVAARRVVTMMIWSADGMTRSTARPAGINGKMRFDKEIRQSELYRRHFFAVTPA